jgi:DNA modification methylase
MFNEPAEDLIIKKGYFDLIFSSPPYFKKEIYDTCKTQSCNKYPEYQEWVTNFLEKVIENCKHMLKKDGFFVININDIRLGATQYPLTKDTKRLARKHGFKLVNTLYYGLSRIIGTHKTATGQMKREPIFIFKIK